VSDTYNNFGKMLLATGDSEAKAASDAETIATITRDLAAAREHTQTLERAFMEAEKQLAAANATVEMLRGLTTQHPQIQVIASTTKHFDTSKLESRVAVTDSTGTVRAWIVDVGDIESEHELAMICKGRLDLAHTRTAAEAAREGKGGA